MYRDQLAETLNIALVRQGLDISVTEIHLERPANLEHGDWSSNVALAFAKKLGLNPRELAQRIIDEVSQDLPSHLEAIEVAGPGFINFRLKDSWLHEVLSLVISLGEEGYARSDEGIGKSVNLEFVSANPTGPLHAGGGRWGAYGDALTRLFKRQGYTTFTEYYVNDRGVQTELFGASLAARRDGLAPPEDGYQGEYVSEWANEMPEDADPVVWGKQRAIADVSRSLESMNVLFDMWASEQSLVESGAMDEIIEMLRKSKWIEERDGATWLRTTEFGDEKDRVLIKSDGEPTYFLPDIAYHHSKFSRGDHVIDILGADHHGYVARISAAMQMLGHPKESYEAIIGQNVTLIRDGEEVRLSKRTGTMVEVRELVEAVGPDMARFAYLLQSIDTRQTIDIDALSKKANENPVFYVQYAHARIAAVAREAVNRGVGRQDLSLVDTSVLVEKRELELLRVISLLPEVSDLALRERSPHKISTWVRELAASFHGFYHDCPILRSDVAAETQQARLWLVEAARIALAIGLDLLGVSAPEEM